MTIPFRLFYRDDITPSQKWLLCVLLDKATSDGQLSITRYTLEHSCYLDGADVASDLTALVLARDVVLHVEHTSEGDLYEMRMASRLELAVLA